MIENPEALLLYFLQARCPQLAYIRWLYRLDRTNPMPVTFPRSYTRLDEVQGLSLIGNAPKSTTNVILKVQHAWVLVGDTLAIVG